MTTPWATEAKQAAAKPWDIGLAVVLAVALPAEALLGLSLLCSRPINVRIVIVSLAVLWAVCRIAT